MKFERSSLVFLAATALLPAVTNAKVCLMVYQVADNAAMEPYLLESYETLAGSDLVRSSEVKTWVYYDAYMTSPEEDTSFTGSRYMTYDSATDAMKVDMELEGEQDSDSAATIQKFLEHAMTDCLMDGYDSLMAVFAGIGGGFAGFGGDDNVARRKLLATRANLALGISDALATHSLTELGVLGFEANLMQGMSVASEFQDIAEYILASESIVPGHGKNVSQDVLILLLLGSILSVFIPIKQVGPMMQLRWATPLSLPWILPHRSTKPTSQLFPTETIRTRTPRHCPFSTQKTS